MHRDYGGAEREEETVVSTFVFVEEEEEGSDFVTSDEEDEGDEHVTSDVDEEEEEGEDTLGSSVNSQDRERSVSEIE